MTDIQFDDGDLAKTEAQHSPSSNQGDSPRATAPENLNNTSAEERERQDFEEWKLQRRITADKVRPDQHGQFDDKPAETAAYSPSAPSGRRVAPTEATKSEVRPQEVEEDEVPQSYVWLPNGEVVLANDEDLPQNAGLGAHHGYWEKDGKAFQIVAVYPKETTLKESK